MREIIYLVVLLFTIFTGSITAQNQPTYMTQKLYLTVDGTTVSVTMFDNVSTRALVALLQESDITYEARDYGGFEKVGALGHTLPSADQQTTTKLGDIVLYSSNQVVIFYGSNSWAYTRIGTIDNATSEDIKQFLKAGQGDIYITLSLKGTTTNLVPEKSVLQDGRAYTIIGQSATANQQGVVIQGGKKIYKK